VAYENETYLKQLKFKTVLQQVKQGVFVLLNAVYMHPVKWTQVYVVGMYVFLLLSVHVFLLLSTYS